jgi:hypothetical protein
MRPIGKGVHPHVTTTSCGLVEDKPQQAHPLDERLDNLTGSPENRILTRRI